MLVCVCVVCSLEFRYRLDQFNFWPFAKAYAIHFALNRHTILRFFVGPCSFAAHISIYVDISVDEHQRGTEEGERESENSKKKKKFSQTHIQTNKNFHFDIIVLCAVHRKTHHHRTKHTVYTQITAKAKIIE